MEQELYDKLDGLDRKELDERLARELCWLAVFFVVTLAGIIVLGRMDPNADKDK